MVVNQYVDWCSHNKSQKEITKNTVACEFFIQRKTSSTISETPEIPNEKKETLKEISESKHSNPTPKVELQHLNRRELAFETERSITLLLEKDRGNRDLNIIQAFLQPIIENEKEKDFKEKLHITTSFNQFVPSKEISKIIHVLNNATHYYESAQEEIRKYQRRQQDILHAFELTDLSEDELTEYTKELQSIRIFRRQAKNFIETLEPLYGFSLKNKEFIEQLKKLNGEMDKIKNTIENRRYFVREETSLKRAFEEARPLHKRMNAMI